MLGTTVYAHQRQPSPKNRGYFMAAPSLIDRFRPRPTRPEDLSECVELVRQEYWGRPMPEPAELRNMWYTLLEESQALSGVVQDTDAHGKIVALGMGVFVTDDFVEHMST